MNSFLFLHLLYIGLFLFSNEGIVFKKIIINNNILIIIVTNINIIIDIIIKLMYDLRRLKRIKSKNDNILTKDKN